MLADKITINATDRRGQIKGVKMLRDNKAKFNFGPLRFTVTNPAGVFVPSDNLKQTIAAMSMEDATAANREAWKLRKQYERVMNRHNNATLYPGVYASVAGPHTVTEAVCRLTYRRMMV